MDNQALGLAAAAEALAGGMNPGLAYFLKGAVPGGSWMQNQSAVNLALDAFLAAPQQAVQLPAGLDIQGYSGQLQDGQRKRFIFDPTTRLYQTSATQIPLTLYTTPLWVANVTAITTVTGQDLNDNDADAQPANTVIKITFDGAAQTWPKNARFKLISEDPVPEAQNGGSSNAARLGEFISAGQASSVSGGNTLITTALLAEPAGSSAYATSARLVCLAEATAFIEGATGAYDPSIATATAGTMGLIALLGLTDPLVRDFMPQSAISVGVIVQGCVRALIDDSSFNRQLNSPARNQYGYGVRLTSSVGTQVKSVHARGVRHLSTSADFPITTAQTGVNIHQYGRDWYGAIIDCYAEECANAGIDAHDASYGFRIINPVVDRCYAGASGNGFAVSMRGVKTQCIGGLSTNNRAGIGFCGKEQLIDGGYWQGNQYALSWNASTAGIPFPITGEARDATFECPPGAANVYGQGQTEALTIGTFTGGGSATAPITTAIKGNGATWISWVHGGTTYYAQLATTAAKGDTTLTLANAAATTNMTTGDAVTLCYVSQIKEKNCRHVVKGSGSHTATIQLNYPVTWECENLVLDYSLLTGAAALTPFQINCDGVTIKIRNLRIIPGSNTLAAFISPGAYWSGTTFIEIENVDYGNADGAAAAPIGGTASSNPFGIVPSTMPNIRVSGIQRSTSGEWNTKFIAVTANSYTSTPLPVQGRMDPEVVIVFSGDTAARTLASWAAYTTASMRRNQVFTVSNQGAYPITLTSFNGYVLPPNAWARFQFNNTAGTIYTIETGGPGRVIKTTNGAYAAVAGDSGCLMGLNNASASTVTFPNTLPQGWNCDYYQVGAGAYTFSVAAGGTLDKKSGLTGVTNGQWTRCRAECISNPDGATATILLTGDGLA